MHAINDVDRSHVIIDKIKKHAINGIVIYTRNGKRKSVYIAMI